MSHDATDTIAAIATPPGRGGIGIVRVSGPQAAAIALAVAGELPAPRQAVFRAFIDEQQQILDEGLVLYFPAPHSFTGEDVLEFQGHGGPVVLDLLLQTLIAHGARQARPGEFSERAFLNDKLDLVQAEAIADLIDSSSTQAARAALRSLQGDFSQAVQALDEAIIALRTYVEASIDFPDEDVAEDDITFLAAPQVQERINEIQTRFNDLETRAQQGALLRDGLTLVIAGQPNAGKSSLLNALAGYEAAIVTDIPGTTRDVLRERILLDGIPLHIIDTAGLRDSGDKIELQGVQRARAEISRANAVLLIVDATSGWQAADSAILDTIDPRLPTIIVFNKTDLTTDFVIPHRSEESATSLPIPAGKALSSPALPTGETVSSLYLPSREATSTPPLPSGEALSTLPLPFGEALSTLPLPFGERAGVRGSRQTLPISALTGAGLDALRQMLREITGTQHSNSDTFSARRRHLEALKNARHHLETGLIQLKTRQAGELFAEELRLSHQALSEITGSYNTEALLGEIFSSFCIGK